MTKKRKTIQLQEQKWPRKTTAKTKKKTTSTNLNKYTTKEQATKEDARQRSAEENTKQISLHKIDRKTFSQKYSEPGTNCNRKV